MDSVRRLGSPPRGRGKAWPPKAGGWVPGITPAWAGKSPRPTSTLWSSRDHPRVGGEKAPQGQRLNLILGSPPRGRGKAPSFRDLRHWHRITPAWAGKSIRCTSTTRLIRDHPRVGGEKAAFQIITLPFQGSPPRGRGKAFPSPCGTGPVGITPAWAGKRCLQDDRHHESRDHPRVGGEKIFPRARRTAGRGSPPRGRGKALIRMGAGLAAGITPAWAGKSAAQHVRYPAPKDHPRVGGEKLQLAIASTLFLGSPPRGRGKGGKLTGRVRPEGITPAWAGKRSNRTPWWAVARDHPRVGGEK